jgi:hypothetical protein
MIILDLFLFISLIINMIHTIRFIMLCRYLVFVVSRIESFAYIFFWLLSIFLLFYKHK